MIFDLRIQADVETDEAAAESGSEADAQVIDAEAANLPEPVNLPAAEPADTDTRCSAQFSRGCYQLKHYG